MKSYKFIQNLIVEFKSPIKQEDVRWYHKIFGVPKITKNYRVKLSRTQVLDNEPQVGDVLDWSLGRTYEPGIEILDKVIRCKSAYESRVEFIFGKLITTLHGDQWCSDTVVAEHMTEIFSELGWTVESIKTQSP